MNKFLIIVDMQNDFITGSLGTKEAQAIVPRVVERINQAKRDGWIIITTQDTHHQGYLTTNEGKHLPVEHCIIDTPGWELCDEVQEAIKNYPSFNFTKQTFGSLELSDKLLDFTVYLQNIDLCEKVTFEIIGLCTDICVVSNAMLIKAAFPEDIVQVNAACCAGVTPELHEAALKVMKSCQIEVI